jgi:carbon monoxide dehydrogenase subunit G
VKLEQSFEVAAPLERVWQALIDVEQVAPCLPGAAVTGRNDDGTYNGTFTVKIGPTTASYTGKLAMEAVDEGEHSATMQAQGTDKRGQGGAKATIVSKLSPAGDGATRVEVDTDYHITGRLARFGRGGMIEDISERLLREFAGCLQSSLGEAAPPAEPVAEEPPDGGEAAGQPPIEPALPPTEAPPPPTEGPPPTEAALPAAGPAPVAPAPPVQGLSLVGSVLVARARRNPKPLLAVIGALLFLRLRRRGR